MDTNSDNSTFVCGNSTYNVNDTAVSTLLEISDFAFTAASCSPLVVSIVFLMAIIIGVIKKLYRWQEFILTANRNYADILLALAMVIHYETRSVHDSGAPGAIEYMFSIPGASWIGPKWIHFLFTLDFLMVLAVSSVSSIISAYALQQPTSYDDKVTASFLIKISIVMWIVTGGISYLITIPDHHSTFAGKTLDHMQHPNPDGTLTQIGLFCHQFEEEEMGIVEESTAALAIPLLCYLIVTSSFFSLMVILWRNRMKTRHYFESFSSACRIGIHVAIYYIFLTFYLFAYFESSKARAVCLDSKNICEVLDDVPVMRKYIYASVTATVVWLIRMVVDPVVDWVGDKRFRKIFQRRHNEVDDLVEMLEQNQEETELSED